MSSSESKIVSSLTQEAADWHARLRSDSLSEVEEGRFRAWLSGDPARRREFDALSALWDSLETVAQSPEVLRERQQMATSAAPERISRRAVVGWVLAAGVAGAAGFISWEQLFAADRYATGVGEQRIVPLSDGSIVTLNTSSQVRVRITGARRRVEVLRGQANFEVAEDLSRPFIVSAGGGEVRALGTVFDVYRRAGDVVVTLIEGRVSVVPDAHAGENGAIVLDAGEQLSFGAPGRAPARRNADLRQVSAWRNRKLLFADTPLAEAIAEANRYSRIKIELRDAHLADARISGTFDAGRNEAVAEGLQAYFGLEAERPVADLIVLSSAHPR
jgi:transmembrane sensor